MFLHLSAAHRYLSQISPPIKGRNKRFLLVRLVPFLPMSFSSFRIRTLVYHTWRATYTNPSLLVFGLTMAILTLLINSILFPFLETLQDGSVPDIFQGTLSPISLFILPALLCKTFAASQVFILQASHFLRRPHLLAPRARLEGGLLYVGVEILHAFLLICISYFLLIIPLSHFEPTSALSSLVVSVLLGIFFFAVLDTSIIKHLFLGYFLLSPLHLRSSLSLSIQLFVRYQYFSVLSFLFVLFFTLLFTILENLVMLQYAFVGQHSATSGVFVYLVLLLVNTFIAVFTEVFWLNFFFALTNKHREAKDLIPLLRKEREEAAPIPS